MAAITPPQPPLSYDDVQPSSPAVLTKDPKKVATGQAGAAAHKKKCQPFLFELARANAALADKVSSQNIKTR